MVAQFLSLDWSIALYALVLPLQGSQIRILGVAFIKEDKMYNRKNALSLLLHAHELHEMARKLTVDDFVKDLLIRLNALYFFRDQEVILEATRVHEAVMEKPEKKPFVPPSPAKRK